MKLVYSFFTHHFRAENPRWLPNSDKKSFLIPFSQYQPSYQVESKLGVFLAQILIITSVCNLPLDIYSQCKQER